MIVTIGGDKETFSPKRIGSTWWEYMAGSCNGTSLLGMDDKGDGLG